MKEPNERPAVTGLADPYALFERLAAPLEEIRRTLGVEPQDVSDIRQNVTRSFLLLAATIVSPEGWVLTAFRHECIKFLRRRKLSGERNSSRWIRPRSGALKGGCSPSFVALPD